MKKQLLLLYGCSLVLGITLVLCAHFDVSAYPSGSSGYYAAILRDANSNPIKVGSSIPYSPKQTCGYGGVNGINCHVDMVKSFGLSSGNIYESDVRSATHDHGAGTTGYAVPYPLHGVSAAYHVQQGRNMPWGQVQREYYQKTAVDSSAGMSGLFCPTTNRQLADLGAADASQFDQGSYDFAHSSCAMCHVGGGPIEYDREGYRYDGTTGLFQSGLNPNPKSGDYYSYDPANGTIVSNAAAWQSGGVAEVDCLVCHLGSSVTRTGVAEADCLSAGGSWTATSSKCVMPFRYSIIERNFALAEGKSPALAASLGLTGTSAINAFLNIPRKAGDGINPDISQGGWSWTANYKVNVDDVLFDAVLISSPKKESCALCHFADKSDLAPGPVGKPTGYTAFQKVIPAGTAIDGDRAGGGTNAVDWKVSTYRAESRNNGASINDPLNPDAHMDRGRNCTFCHYLLGTPRDYNTDCMTCHYEYYGPEPLPVTPVSPEVFPALTDASGRVIQPSVEVFRIDHQFAKGNNKPYGLNMDQLDNTVTCENCHITRTHPNAASAPDPSAAHAGFPAFHFDRIDCRSCHIPMMNFTEKQILADFSAGPYQGGERGQYRSDPQGIQLRPLYVIRPTNHDGSGLKIKPTAPLVAAGWIDGTESKPVIPRLAQAAAEARRAGLGDGNADGWYDWPLNMVQGGDTSLIVNTQTEISDMVSKLHDAGINTPVMNLSIDAFSMSHNVAPKSSNRILGSPNGGGCIMCHASVDPSSPNYSTKAVGFFDQVYTLFNQPNDGGHGLVQTEIDGVKRVTINMKLQKMNGAVFDINLSKSHGETVANTLRQSDVLGYTDASIPDAVTGWTDPSIAGVAKPTTVFSWTSDTSVSNKVNFDSSGTTCPSGTCEYIWNFGGAGTPDLAGIVTPTFIYDAAGTYTVTLTVNDTVTGLRSSTSTAVAAKVLNMAPSAYAALSVSGMTVTVADSSTDDQPGVRVTVSWGDGKSTTQDAGTTFTHLYPAAGTYTVTHMAVDAGGLSASADLSPSDPTTLNARVTLPVKYSVSGSVTMADGTTPLSGVAIYLKQGTGTKYIGSTNTSGVFTINNVAGGTYDVVPVKAGYTFTPATRSVTVGPNASGLTFTAL